MNAPVPFDSAGEQLFDNSPRAVAAKKPAIPDHPATPELATRVRRAIESLRLLEPVSDEPRIVSTLSHIKNRVATRISRNDTSRPLPELIGYEIVEQIGRGGMGVVYRGVRTSDGLKVALKALLNWGVVDQGRIERFRHEARLAASLSAPGVVPVLDVLESADSPVLVMPFIDGIDLSGLMQYRQRERRRQVEAIAEPGAITVDQGPDDQAFVEMMLGILDQVLVTVAAVHEVGVMHRDLKPSNILIGRDGRAWVTDFGLARAEGPRQLTVTGMVLGTPGYMAPEQWEVLKDVDRRADVFALGATAYQMLTSELPFGTAHDGLSKRPLPPSRRQLRVPVELDAVLLKSLEYDRRDRYPSATEMLADWEKARSGNRLRVGVRPIFRKAARGVWRRRLPMAACLIALLLGGSAAWVAARNGAGAQSQKVVGPPDEIPSDWNVSIRTDPPGARVAMAPMDGIAPDLSKVIRSAPGQVTPLILTGVPPGLYHVVVDIPGHGFQEVYRTVPPRTADMPQTDRVVGWKRHRKWSVSNQSTITWRGEINIPKVPQVIQGMVPFRGGMFWMGKPGEPPNKEVHPFQTEVRPFYLAPTETTVGEIRQAHASGPKTWPVPEIEDWKNHTADWPATSLDLDQAIAFAEMVGKRLMWESEYEFAATNGGRTPFPWGHAPVPQSARWPISPVGPAGVSKADFTETEPRVYGLFSNAIEWTWTPAGSYPNRRRPPADLTRDAWIVRGGASPMIRLVEDGEAIPAIQELDRGVWHRMTWRRDTVGQGLGFRLARSVTPPYLD